MAQITKDQYADAIIEAIGVMSVEDKPALVDILKRNGSMITEMSTEARLMGESDEIYAEIRNCSSPANCKNLWSELLSTPDPTIRQCGVCKKNVYLCETARNLQRSIVANNAVAIPIRRIKKSHKSR